MTTSTSDSGYASAGTFDGERDLSAIRIRVFRSTPRPEEGGCLSTLENKDASSARKSAGRPGIPRLGPRERDGGRVSFVRSTANARPSSSSL
jgi:hypothetical protein